MDSRMVPNKKGGKVDFEFKSEDDGAWYESFIRVPEDSRLYIRYKKFPKSHDHIFPLEKFKTREELEARLRVSAVQLQDAQCSEVKEKMVISASCSTGRKDLRFFTAVVEEIRQSRHSKRKGEEVCNCKFKVLWQDGPKANQKTYISCENICLLSTRSIDEHPKVKRLLKLIKKKFSSNIASPVQAFGSNSYPELISIKLKPMLKEVEKGVIGKENVVDNSHYVLGDGIMFKDDRPSKIPRRQGESHVYNKDPLPAPAPPAASTSNSHSEITDEAPFDPNIYRECMKFKEKEKRAFDFDLNFPLEEYMEKKKQIESQTNINMEEKEQTHIFGSNLKFKEKVKRVFDFDLNFPLEEYMEKKKQIESQTNINMEEKEQTHIFGSNLKFKEKVKRVFDFDLNFPLKEYMEKKKQPFSFGFNLPREDNDSDDIVKESTGQNVGTNLVDNSFEKNVDNENYDFNGMIGYSQRIDKAVT